MSDGIERLNPGQRARVSGQYSAHDESGNYLGFEATSVAGEPLPPLPVPGFWLLADVSARSGDTEKGESP